MFVVLDQFGVVFDEDAEAFAAVPASSPWQKSRVAPRPARRPARPQRLPAQSQRRIHAKKETQLDHYRIIRVTMQRPASLRSEGG